MAEVLVSQGAEARIFRGQLFGREVAIKERFPKKYRHPDLDAKLLPQRLKQEARTVARVVRGGVRTPAVYLVDLATHRIYFEWVDGHTVKSLLQSSCKGVAERNAMGVKIGQAIAHMHNQDIIHGDLTSSNLMCTPQQHIVLIDFGLSSGHGTAEDKAVDLYVMERAFVATHENIAPMVEAILGAYEMASNNARDIMGRLEEVRLRGRKRVMVG